MEQKEFVEKAFKWAFGSSYEIEQLGYEPNTQHGTYVILHKFLNTKNIVVEFSVSTKENEYNVFQARQGIDDRLLTNYISLSYWVKFLELLSNK